jgi:hypothetical protein
MLTPEQIRRRATNRYEDFLRSLCTGESLFPLALFGSGLKNPKDFGGDRAAIESLRKSSKEQLTLWLRNRLGAAEFSPNGDAKRPSQSHIPRAG